MGYGSEANGYIRLDILSRHVKKAKKKAVTAISLKNVSAGNKAEHLPLLLLILKSIGYVFLDGKYCFIYRKCFCNLI